MDNHYVQLIMRQLRVVLSPLRVAWRSLLGAIRLASHMAFLLFDMVQWMGVSHYGMCF